MDNNSAVEGKLPGGSRITDDELTRVAESGARCESLRQMTEENYVVGHRCRWSHLVPGCVVHDRIDDAEESSWLDVLLRDFFPVLWVIGAFMKPAEAWRA
jgi:hypothetical protein